MRRHVHKLCTVIDLPTLIDRPVHRCIHAICKTKVLLAVLLPRGKELLLRISDGLVKGVDLTPAVERPLRVVAEVRIGQTHR